MCSHGERHRLAREWLQFDELGEAQLPRNQLEPWTAEAKAEVPAHAQRMSSLLALDKATPCRVQRKACAMRGERARGGGDASGMHEESPTQG